MGSAEPKRDNTSMLAWENEKKEELAQESSKTRKVREKLREKYELVEKKVTPKALKKKGLEIHQWIDRHASERIILQSKTISLFDSNQNAAKLSARVALLAEQIKEESWNNLKSSNVQ